MPKVPVEAAFLGPYGENNELFEQILVEFLRDHVYWRRNFHPEDPPPIPTFASLDPQYRAFVADMRQELHRLSAALKRSVPFSSPRYIGHMASDPILPGLLAQMITLPYNPNNVVEDVAPVTVEMELDAGLMLAEMVGFPTDRTALDCAFGHLTSGGTIANYEALVLHRALRFYPLATASVLRDAGLPGPSTDLAAPLCDLDDWSLCNLSTDDVVALRETLPHYLETEVGTREAGRLLRRVEDARIERLGLVEFHLRHPQIAPPRVLVPHTAHYSWEKGMKLLGLGSSHLIHVPETGMRMDADALDDQLRAAQEARAPVLAVMAVMGTTEFGTVDPIHRVADAREEWAADGLGFGIHIDAAWGGYLASMFRAPDGTLIPREEMAEGFDHFPSPEVYDAFAAMGRTDSVTVDPHKLGYFPFGTGAFICRDQRMMDLVAQSAAYVFDRPDDQGHSRNERFHALGRFILEGSKSGANAAAVYVTHKVLPLHSEGFGELAHRTVQNTEHFYARIQRTAEELEGHARLILPYVPDTNLVCIALNPEGETTLAGANAFTRRIFDLIKVDASQPLQLKSFFGSYTSLDPRVLGRDEGPRILDALGIDLGTFSSDPITEDGEADHIFILRHTLMNPWLNDEVNGINYIDLYCDFLRDSILAELDSEGRPV